MVSIYPPLMVSPRHVRRLQNLIHPLRTQSAFHEITDCDGTDKGRQTGILTLLLGDILGKDLCGIGK